jgi:hypothetical protein
MALILRQIALRKKKRLLESSLKVASPATKSRYRTGPYKQGLQYGTKCPAWQMLDDSSSFLRNCAADAVADRATDALCHADALFHFESSIVFYFTALYSRSGAVPEWVLLPVYSMALFNDIRFSRYGILAHLSAFRHYRKDWQRRQQVRKW